MEKRTSARLAALAKSIECPYCDFTSTRPSEVTLHLRTHETYQQAKPKQTTRVSRQRTVLPRELRHIQDEALAKAERLGREKRIKSVVSKNKTKERAASTKERKESHLAVRSSPSKRPAPPAKKAVGANKKTKTTAVKEKVAASYQLTPDGIDSLYTLKRPPSNNTKPRVALRLQVLSLNRYVIDPQLNRITGRTTGVPTEQDVERVSQSVQAFRDLPKEDRPAYVTRLLEITANEFSTNVFDIVLHDGTTAAKCLLDVSLHALVACGALQIGSVVDVTEWTTWYDETSAGGSPGFVIVKDLTLVAPPTPVNELPAPIYKLSHGHKPRERWSLLRNEGVVSLAWYDEKNTCVKLPSMKLRDTPLLGSRGYYLAERSDDVCTGLHWAALIYDTPSSKEMKNFVISETDKNITEIITKYQERPRGRRRQDESWDPMVGVVVAKSKVTHHGKMSENNRFPLKFTFTLRDEDQDIPVVVWNKGVLKYYHSIFVGDIVVVTHYRIKPAHPHGDGFEIGVNSANPEGFIHHLTAAQVMAISLPPFTLSRRSVSDILTMPPSATVDDEVDIVGVVSFVGRPERRRVAGVDSNLFMYRWLCIVDHTTKREVYIQLYTPTPPRTLDQILVGDLCLLTNLKIVRAPEEVHEQQGMAADLAGDYVFLQSTHFTGFYFDGQSQSVDDFVDKADPVFQFAKDFRENILPLIAPRGAAVPTHPNSTVFVRPRTCAELFRIFPKTPIVPLRELGNVERSMTLYERRSVLVHVKLTALEDSVYSDKSNAEIVLVKATEDHETASNELENTKPKQLMALTGDLTVSAILTGLNTPEEKEVNFLMMRGTGIIARTAPFPSPNEMGTEEQEYQRVTADLSQDCISDKNPFVPLMSRFMAHDEVTPEQLKSLRTVADGVELSDALLKWDVLSQPLVVLLELYRKSHADMDCSVVKMYSAADLKKAYHPLSDD